PVRKSFSCRTGVLRCPWTSWPAVSGVASGELFDELQQCRVVETSVALILEGCKELGHLCTDRDRHADLTCGVCDDTHVLVVQGGAKTRFEVALAHPGPLAPQNGAARQTGTENLEGGTGVHIVGLQEDQRLGQELKVARGHELVGGLDRLSGTAGPDQNGCAAQSVEDGAGCIEVPVTATDHDGERGIDRSGPATTDWGVQDTQA